MGGKSKGAQPGKAVVRKKTQEKPFSCEYIKKMTQKALTSLGSPDII